MVARQKAEAIAKKQYKDKRRNSLFIKNDRYYDSNTYSTHLGQKNGHNLVNNENRRNLVPLY